MADEIISAARLGQAMHAHLRVGRSGAQPGLIRGFVTPQYALVWLAAGRVRLSYRADVWHEVRPGDAFQRWPGRSHDLEVVDAAQWWFVGVPEPAFAALRLVGLPTADQPVLSVGEDPAIPARFATLARQLHVASPDALPASLTALLAWIAELHRRAGQGPHRSAVAAACARIAADPQRVPATAVLARQVGLGHHVFRKAFARAMGCGAQAHAVRLRLERAQELLATTRLPVAEIAARCGWSDPTQFSTLFRRRIGLAPGQWRHGRA